MGRYSSPPPALANAINSSSTRYGVPANLLAGIWQREAGGAYPNPYVNSEGYGGLFGTTNGLAPVQAQADEAASVLAAGLRASGGNVGEALSYYNTGRLTGGYTTVPGETKAQELTGVSTIPGVPSTLASGVVAVRPRPGGSAGGGRSWWQRVESDVGSALGGVEGAALGALGGVEGAVGSVLSDAESLVTGPLDFLKAALWLVNPTSWLRVVEGLLGSVLLIGGVLTATGVTGKAAGLASGLPVPVE